jgi:hypothetical protein
MHWGSHKDIAAKALKKFASPHLPTSLKALERAPQRVHAEHRSAIEQLSKASPGDAEGESKTAVPSLTATLTASRTTRPTSESTRPRWSSGGRHARCGSRRAGQFRTSSGRAASPRYPLAVPDFHSNGEVGIGAGLERAVFASPPRLASYGRRRGVPMPPT